MVRARHPDVHTHPPEGARSTHSGVNTGGTPSWRPFRTVSAVSVENLKMLSQEGVATAGNTKLLHGWSANTERTVDAPSPAKRTGNVALPKRTSGRCHFLGGTQGFFWDTTFREGGAYFGDTKTFLGIQNSLWDTEVLFGIQKENVDKNPKTSRQVSSRVCVCSTGRVLVSKWFPFCRDWALTAGSGTQVQSLWGERVGDSPTIPPTLTALTVHGQPGTPCTNTRGLLGHF